MLKSPAVADYHPAIDAAGTVEAGGLVAQLTAVLGRIQEALPAGDRPRQPVIPWSACHPVGPQAALPGTGTIDVADLFGPHDPYWWDLRRFAAWGFTAGSVTLYKNGTAAQPGPQLALLSAPGNVTWSTQELLAPRDRLIVVAAGITGTVQVELRAIEIETAWLPEYLL